MFNVKITHKGTVEKLVPTELKNQKQNIYTPFLDLAFFNTLRYNTFMAQDYDNMGKRLWTEHAEDLSRFVLAQADVQVLEDLDTDD